MRRKHADLIIAWANGAEIQSRSRTSLSTVWYDDQCPSFDDAMCYRIKPEPKTDTEWFIEAVADGDSFWRKSQNDYQNLKLTFDGETGKLKSAEVLE